MEVTLRRAIKPTNYPQPARTCGRSVAAAPCVRRRGASQTPVLILIVLLAVLATILCYRTLLCRMDSGLRGAVTHHLQELFPEASVFVGRVSADDPHKLVISDVRIAAKGGLPKREVLSAERVILQGDLDIAHYVQQQIRVEQVELFGLELNAWPLSDGSWSLACLEPKPIRDAKPPKVSFKSAILHVHSSSQRDATSIAMHDLCGQIEHRPHPASASNATPDRQRQATASDRAFIHVSGRCSGLLRSIVVDAELDPAQRSLHAAGVIEDLDFSPKMLEQLPPSLAQYLSQLSGLQCRASSTFKMDAAPRQPTSFSLRGRLWSGRLQDRRLPYPLENMSGDFFWTNELLQLRSLQARSGSTQFNLSTDIHGFGLDSPLILRAEAKNLELDQRLYQSLPANWREQWDRLVLAGRVSGHIELVFDGRSWQPSALIECQDVSMQPWLFPYPLTAITGQVAYQQGVVSSQRLEGRAGGQSLQSSFHLSQKEGDWLGKLHFSSNGPISVNEQLVAALTPTGNERTGAESFVRSLHPAGSIELAGATFERSSLQDPGWHRHIDANIYGGTINYAGFQYPIYDIRGRLVGRDDNWTLDRFEGRNDSGRILCSGSWLSGGQGEVPFRLQFQAFDLPAEEELRAALPSDAQFIWDELQPSGALDSVLATIERRDPWSAVDLRIELNEEHASNEIAGRALSLLPKSFPYRLTEVCCNITYEPGFVSVVHASAVNGQTRLALTGECRPNEHGRWLANVRWLPTTRIVVDSQLLKALPPSVRDSLVKLDFSGPVSVIGQSQILFANREHPDLFTSWNCQLDVEDARLADGKNIGDMRGTVWVEGQSDGKQLIASGTLGMDVLSVRGIPIIGLKGPFAFRDSELYFGTTVTDAFPRVGEPAAQPITADALSGRLTLSGHGRLDIGKFACDAELHDAELSALLQDVGVDRPSTQAMCHAKLHFVGIPWNPRTFDGSGTIHLRDAKLYQLPFVMRVLRTAAVTANDDSAFQTADINFQIAGDKIPLQIACDGDVLRLRGEGWTNLRRDVDLELYSYVGRRNPISNVISPLLAESRYATFMLIEVTGTLDNPSMQRRPFPQLEATLQQIFPEVAERQPIREAMPWNR